MSDLVSGDKVILIMDAFNSMADRGGLVRTKELGSLMKRLGENPTKEEVQVTQATVKLEERIEH